MNFDFSDEQKQLRDEARKFLAEKCPPKAVRAVLDGKEPYDRELWKGLADMGFLGVAIPEEFGGAGAGHLELCVIAEEMGRALAPVPFSSTVYLAAEAILLAGSDAQKQKWLPADRLGRGDRHAGAVRRQGQSVAAGDQAHRVRRQPQRRQEAGARWRDRRFRHRRRTHRIERARDRYLAVSGRHESRRRRGQGADQCRSVARPGRTHLQELQGRTARRAGEGWSIISQVLDRAAVLMAFEQVGGADRALEMGRDYALDRIAFGRPIGSFQAVKHMLADMYVSATLARSNCYYGAWALSTNASELPEAAAAARISATQAFQHCAKNNIQVHGGMGFTWEFDCHMYYRRANATALALGSLSYWEDALIDRMRKRNAA